MKDKWLEMFNPYQGGGSMIDNVEIDKTKFAKGFQKFEAGTPPIAQVIGLGASINFVDKIGLKRKKSDILMTILGTLPPLTE